MFSSLSYVHTRLKETWSCRLTFDCGDHRPGRAEDVHRVEPLVFADDGLQDSQQLPETLVHSLVEAILVLCKDTSLQLDTRHFFFRGGFLFQFLKGQSCFSLGFYTNNKVKDALQSST